MQFELCISQILNKKLEEITFYWCIYALHLFCYELFHDDFLNSLLQLHIGQINVFWQKSNIWFLVDELTLKHKCKTCTERRTFISDRYSNWEVTLIPLRYELQIIYFPKPRAERTCFVCETGFSSRTPWGRIRSGGDCRYQRVWCNGSEIYGRYYCPETVVKWITLQESEWGQSENRLQ